MLSFRFPKNLILSTLLAIAATLPIGAAKAESVFAPYKASIREQIPVGLSLRLPDKILINPTEQANIENFTIRVFVNENPKRMTVSVHSCQSGAEPCLIGSFVTENKNDTNVQRDLKQHKTDGLRITLKDDIAGYVLDNATQQAGKPFATLMWTQDNMIYTLSFPQTERQNMLYMALSMANSDAIFRP